MIRGLRILLLVGVATHWAAAASPIAETEALQTPTTARITAVMNAAQREGWAAQAEPLRAAAERAYRQERLPVAQAWLNLYRWTALWGILDSEFTTQWYAALDAVHLRHANIPGAMPTRRLPMGYLLLPELQFWLLSNDEFATEFFALVTPLDYLPNVFTILNELHFENPNQFKTYANLALAIAVVYDVPPPPNWPHSQMPANAAGRKLPKPLEAFSWWAREDEAGRTYHRLAELGANELKFVVDSPAPFLELEWSQRAVAHPLASFANAYMMVPYDAGRVQRNELSWPTATYTLGDILTAGGICVDQAYFATSAGKARGIPTLLFRGWGTTSRHAWFGFLDDKKEWEFDVGRYAEQRFVTGYAIDPQSWRPISDHELRFLAARFLQQPAYLESRIHSAFAASFLLHGNEVAAGSAAWKSVKLEPRNFPGWETMLSAEQRLGFTAQQREATLREAVVALQNFPDLEESYSARLSESLRARGKTGAANKEKKRIEKKNQKDREDIALLRARGSLVADFDQRPLADQINHFKALVGAQPKGTAVAFFDQIVLVFVEHLIRLQKREEAMSAVEFARTTLQVDANSPLGRDFARLTEVIKSAVP
jgi:hypothetical protein